MQVLGLLYPDVLHDVPHPDPVGPGDGGGGPHDQPLGPLGGQGLLVHPQVQAQPLIALKADLQPLATAQGTEADIMTSNWRRKFRYKRLEIDAKKLTGGLRRVIPDSRVGLVSCLGIGINVPAYESS